MLRHKSGVGLCVHRFSVGRIAAGYFGGSVNKESEGVFFIGCFDDGVVG